MYFFGMLRRHTVRPDVKYCYRLQGALCLCATTKLTIYGTHDGPSCPFFPIPHSCKCCKAEEYGQRSLHESDPGIPPSPLPPQDSSPLPVDRPDRPPSISITAQRNTGPVVDMLASQPMRADKSLTRLPEYSDDSQPARPYS